jgi:hypothetical protein
LSGVAIVKGELGVFETRPDPRHEVTSLAHAGPPTGLAVRQQWTRDLTGKVRRATSQHQ